MTTRITVTLDDRLAEQVRAAATDSAGGNVSDWISKACVSRMLSEEARALAAWQRAHPEETTEFYREREAEHEAMHAAAHQGDAA